MLAVLLACALLAQQTESIRSVFELSGEVDRIDRTGRTISLRSTGVVDAPIYVGPDLPIFNELKSGDIVTVRYFDSYIVAVTPGERMTQVENTTAEAQEATVTQPDGTVLRQARVVVTIDAIDVATATVTYHGFDNRKVFRVVQDRRLLEGVKVGDVVTILYTRAQAVTITKQ